MAPVIDLEQARKQRARRGGQIPRGQLHRVNPGRRDPRRVLYRDVTPEMWADAVIKGDLSAVTKKVRRAGAKIRRRRLPLSRAQRRLAWKVERRASDVAWRDSRSARGELAPVVPIGHRGLVRRLGIRPVGGVSAASDPMDDAA